MDKKQTQYIWNALLAIALLFAVAFIYWVLGRNVNFDDEGFYMVPYVSDQYIELLPSQQYSFLLKWILPAEWISLFNLRLVRLFFTVASSLYLAIACYFYLLKHNVRINKAFLLLLVPLLSLSNFVFGPLALSYNSQTHISLSITMGGLLLAYSAKSRQAHLILSGVFLGLAYYAKFTSGISAFLLLSFSILLVKESWLDKSKKLIYLLIGVIASLWIFNHVYSFNDILSDGLSLSELSNAGYDLWNQIERPWRFFINSLKYLIAGGLIGLTFLFKKNKWTIGILTTALATGLLIYERQSIAYTKGFPIYLLLFGITLVPTLVKNRKHLRRGSLQIHLMVLILLIVCGVLGTNNLWMVSSNFFSLYLLLATLFLAFKLRSKYLIFFVALTCFVNTLYYTHLPYRSPDPKYATVEVGNTRLGPIKISKEHAEIYHQFKDIVRDKELTNDDYLGILWKYPMINFLFDIPSPAGIIWELEQIELTRHNYFNRKDKGRQVHWIVINEDSTRSPLSHVIELTRDTSFKVRKQYSFKKQEWFYISN